MTWLSRRLFRRVLARPARATRHSARPLASERLEDRLVPDGRPLALPVIYAGAGEGHAPVVKAYDAEHGTLNFERTVYDPSFTGGVRVAVADFTRDGFPDVVVAPGPGGGPNVKVLDGKTGDPVPGAVGSFWAYEETFTGGLMVAAGEVDGDGVPDVITAAGHGGGPRVRVFSGADGGVIRDFFAFDPDFLGGVSVAAADVTGDGLVDLAVGAGEGGAPHVKVYDLFSMAPVAGPLGSFFAFDPATRGGVSVGADALAGDVDADGTPDLAVGTGPGDAPEVRVFSGATGGTLLAFAPFGAEATGGVRVALAYVSDDPHADVVVGTGPGPVATVRVFDGATGLQLPPPVGEYQPFGPSAIGGVWVAASNDPVTPTMYISATIPIAAKGQTVGYRVQVNKMGTNPTPTGLVTFYDAVTNASLGAELLAPGPDGNAYAGVLTTSLAVTTSGMGVRAVYAGDGNYWSVTANGAYNSLTSGLQSAGDCGCGTVTAAGAGGVPGAAGLTAGGVAFDGSVRVKREDLAGLTGGAAGRLAWTWASAPGATGPGSPQAGTQAAGPGVWLARANGNNLSALAVVEDGAPVVFFDKYYKNFVTPETPAYYPRYNEPYKLTEDPANGLLKVTDGRGAEYAFWDFSTGNVSAGLAGRLKAETAPGGSQSAVVSYDGLGRPTETQSVVGSGGAAVTESFLSDYAAGTVTQRRKVGAGAWATVRTAASGYYTGTAGRGAAGQLRTAQVKDPAGSVLETNYYRYYTGSGSGGGGVTGGPLKYAFGPAAYERLVAALGTGLDALSDAQVAPYADSYFEYDAQWRVTKAVRAGDGCSACTGGQGAYTYAYNERAEPLTRLPNTWVRKVVETLPDGNQNTYYANQNNDLLLRVYKEAGTGREWGWATKYDGYRVATGRTTDATWRVVQTAEPSAVSGYDEALDDLVGYSGTGATHVRAAAGLVTAYDYGVFTTASTTADGDVQGFLKQTSVRRGTGGILVPRSTEAYRQAADGKTYVTAASTVYRDAGGAGARTTTRTYTWQGATAQPDTVTTTYPTVTAAQNGPGTATSSVVAYDAFGRPTWAKDAAAFLTYTAYDPATGAVIKTIQDVDTDLTGTFTGLPSGWSNPTGLHLTATYEADALGRTTKVIRPDGVVDYTVYNDASHEVRSYPGWDPAANGGAGGPTGPTGLTRLDRARGYTESLTMSATPAVNGGRPTGGEAISALRSLSRSLVNSAGQAVSQDAYADLSGLTYSTTAVLPGATVGTHYYRTEQGYAHGGRPNKAVSPQGTITRTVIDGLGRAVSEWVGTDDIGATNSDPTGGGAAGNNMRKVGESEYDGGGVGDGNQTKTTAYPGLGAAPRVTQTWYDWRNRAVLSKAGVEASEAAGVNRPISYTDYDNLGAVTKTRVYDGDGVAVTTTNGVPDTPAASLLRAQSTTSYDELGRAYRSEAYSVDPATGAVGVNTLKSDTWYDARGQVVKSTAPGGLVQKTAYDGAGRATTTYATDGGGDAGYADADDVAGDAVLEQAEMVYDDGGKVLTTTARQRFHDETATGAIGNPTTGPKARVSYQGYYYDAGGRPTAAVDVGTNGGSVWTRPGTVPARSDTALVTSTAYVGDAEQTVRLIGSPAGGTFTLSFGGQTTAAIAHNAAPAAVQSALTALSSVGAGNAAVVTAPAGGWQVRFIAAKGGRYQSLMTASGAGLTGGVSPGVAVGVLAWGGDAGRAESTTDPKGLVSRIYADPLGRTTRAVGNYVDGAVSDADDLTTDYGYNGVGRTSLTVRLTGGGAQTTQWVWGVTATGGNGLDSNDVVGRTWWPDPSTGAASSSQQDAMTVNALGEPATRADRNGSVHTITYDVLGRGVSDAVTTLGSGVDGLVRRVETAYDGQGNPFRVTAYSAASGGSVVNEVKRDYNGLGQLTADWQSHSGAVTGSSPKVQYAYTEMAGGANHSRPTSVTYPSGYVLTSNYASGLASNISRLSSLSDTSGTVEGYDYLGLGTVVRRTHPLPGVDLTYVKQTGESNGDAGDQYTGLDRFGRVVDQRWLKTSGGTHTDRFQYGYDRDGNRLYRDNLVNVAFGELYGYDGTGQVTGFDRGTLNGTKTGLTGAASRTQGWDYDAAGNWDAVTTNGTAQTRTANKQNEVTAVSGATTPVFDGTGNLTTDETGKQYVYDAWGRMVVVKNSGGTTLETLAYDGLGRRVSGATSGTTTDLYYDGWQVAEEKVGSNTAARYVWSPVYVDALVVRDRDTDANGTLDERLWAQQDANWNLTALVSGSGVPVERYAYDPFGARTVYDASYAVRSGGTAYGNAIGFQGLRQDGPSGLLESDYRWYSPSLGRWTTLDPIRYAGEDVNLYRQVGNSPFNFTDPLGLSKYEYPPDGFGNGYDILISENTARRVARIPALDDIMGHFPNLHGWEIAPNGRPQFSSEATNSRTWRDVEFGFLPITIDRRDYKSAVMYWSPWTIPYWSPVQINGQYVITGSTLPLTANANIAFPFTIGFERSTAKGVNGQVQGGFEVSKVSVGGAVGGSMEWGTATSITVPVPIEYPGEKGYVYRAILVQERRRSVAILTGILIYGGYYPDERGEHHNRLIKDGEYGFKYQFRFSGDKGTDNVSALIIRKPC